VLEVRDRSPVGGGQNLEVGMNTDEARQRRRLERLKQIADEYTEAVYDPEAREQLAQREPASRYATVTSEGSAESSHASNGNLLVFGSLREMAEVLGGEATEGWLTHGHAWDLDAGWDPWGNLEVHYAVEVGQRQTEPLIAVTVAGREDGLHLFAASADADSFAEEVRQNGASAQVFEVAVNDLAATRILIEAERQR
jgi:hypothetical protein